MAEQNKKWKDIYELRGMINYCKMVKRNTCDDEEAELMDEFISDYENQINEMIGV